MNNNPEFKKLENEIEKLRSEIIRLNDICAEKLAEITKDKTSRVLSYATTQEIEETVDRYTKKLAKLIVELEELEEVRTEFLNSLPEHDHDHHDTEEE